MREVKRRRRTTLLKALSVRPGVVRSVYVVLVGLFEEMFDWHNWKRIWRIRYIRAKKR